MSLICTSSPTVMKGPPGYPSTGSPISAHRGQKERGESYISGDVRCHSGYTRYVRAVDAVHVESVELDSTRTDGTKTTKKLEETYGSAIYIQMYGYDRKSVVSRDSSCECGSCGSRPRGRKYNADVSAGGRTRKFAV